MPEKQLIEKITTSGLIKKNDRIVIGLSGGPDSTALAILLNKLRNKNNLSLFLVHINYHLRGKDSDKDENFCRNMARKLELPFYLLPVNKNILENSNNSLQDTARELRLEFFLKIAQKHNVNKIALAHQADDQAETVLFNFLRGSGKQGLSGIPVKRPLTKKIVLVHPMLSISRKDILSFLKKEKITFRVDASNKKIIYMRNKIRLKLIPFLEKYYQPQLKNRLNNMSNILSLENDYLENLAGRIAKKIIIKKPKKNNNILEVSVNKLLKLHPAVQARVLQSCAREFTSGHNIDFNHIKAIQKILSGKNLKTNLPRKLIAKKIREKLLFYCNN
ncbi:MAG: tRNA lysidine(34) synthetase TilS [bacterium]